MKRFMILLKKHLIPLLIILIFCISTSKLICENDLFFDIKTGESILKHGLDFKDHFSWIPGLTYLYLHWLYDIFVYCVVILFNFNGLFIFFTVCFSIFSIVFYYELYKTKESKLLATLFTIVMILFCKYAFLSRVQSIIYLLLFLEVIFLEKLYTTGKTKYSIYLILLSILVVNLQMPIWIFYLILTLPYLTEILFSKLLNKCMYFKHVNIEKAVKPKFFLLTILLIIISGFISPLTYHTFTFCLKSLNNPIYQLVNIREMQQTILFSTKIILVIQMIFIICLFFRFIKMTVRDFCLFCGLFLFSLIVGKNVIFFIYFGIYLLYKNIDMRIVIDALEKLKYKINLSVINMLLFLICCYGLYIVVKNKIDNIDNYGVDTYPVEIANYIIDNIDYKNKKFYTDFNTGSYFAFRDIPIFIDSRAEVYIKEFNGGFDILTDFESLSSFNKYKVILDKYEFDYLLLSRGSSLYNFIDKEMDYCIIYGSGEYVIFEYIKEKKYLN